jgi:hypothetical protein
VYLQHYGTVYLAGDKPTVADFHAFEMIDAHEALCKAHGKQTTWQLHSKPFSCARVFFQTVQISKLEIIVHEEARAQLVSVARRFQ